MIFTLYESRANLLDKFQLRDIPNFEQDMETLCDVLTNNAQIGLSRPPDIQSDCSQEELLEASREQKEMLEAVKAAVRSCRHDLSTDDNILSSTEWIGPDAVTKALMREIGPQKLHLYDKNETRDELYNILLYGPEGTGKTALVLSFAKWAGWTFYDVDLSAVLDYRVGQNEKYIARCEDVDNR